MTEHISPEEAEQPPQPPELDRSLNLPGSQIAGVLAFALIVLLAGFGFFGETRATSSSSGSAALDLKVDYPARFRYKQVNPLQVFVTNRSATLLDTVTVVFDTAYIAPFSNVSFTPAAARAWEVELTGLRAGETRRIEVGLQGERYGRHTGHISAYSSSSDTASAKVSTIIFP